MQLREVGYDIVAAAESAELRALQDHDLLRWSQREGRVVVTENVRDFMAPHHMDLGRGDTHAGILFTTPRRFPRRMAAAGSLIAALAAFIGENDDAHIPTGETSWL